MAQRTCQHCGQIFAASKPVEKGETPFCNLGCAVRARVPVDAQGNFPVNQHLVAVLIVVFLFFNQMMFAALSMLLAHRGGVQVSLKLAWISFGLGGLVWLATLVLQKRENVARGQDLVLTGVALVVLFAAIWKTQPRVGLAAAATGILLAWDLRGLIFKQRVR